MQTEFNLMIDYSQTLEQMIAAGRYDWPNSEIMAKRFFVKEVGKIFLKAELVHFNRNISSGGVVFELRKMGKRPATIEELLAFGAQYPEIQREFPVVALGSSAWICGHFVTYLYGDGFKRCLRLHGRGGWWGVSSRFLVFDK